MRSTRAVSIIVSTYNQPDWLYLSLFALLHQTIKDFEVVIADDGSGPRTADVVRALQPEFEGRLRHVWHADKGFRKNIILNEAVRQASGDYLIFIDGDIVAREDFVANHLRLSSPGQFLSGGCLRLTEAVSSAITRDGVASGDVFKMRFLRRIGQPWTSKFIKLVGFGRVSRMLDSVTPTRATFNGMNSSMWRADFYRVNGFDERMAYGGCDREIGERLENAAVTGRQCRYSLACLHLDHGRPYVRRDLMAENLKIRRDVQSRRLRWTEHGIADKLAA
ncbi:MAG: glycosyltransferase [Rhodobiaceae bacterium]|nr:glycosyltransferase [Rhodobiaceae bacterium]